MEERQEAFYEVVPGLFLDQGGVSSRMSAARLAELGINTVLRIGGDRPPVSQEGDTKFVSIKWAGGCLKRMVTSCPNRQAVNGILVCSIAEHMVTLLAMEFYVCTPLEMVYTSFLRQCARGRENA